MIESRTHFSIIIPKRDNNQNYNMGEATAIDFVLGHFEMRRFFSTWDMYNRPTIRAQQQQRELIDCSSAETRSYCCAKYLCASKLIGSLSHQNVVVSRNLWFRFLPRSSLKVRSMHWTFLFWQKFTTRLTWRSIRSHSSSLPLTIWKFPNGLFSHHYFFS